MTSMVLLINATHVTNATRQSGTSGSRGFKINKPDVTTWSLIHVDRGQTVMQLQPSLKLPFFIPSHLLTRWAINYTFSL